MTPVPISHFVAFDAPPVGRQSVRALCGEVVHQTAHANTPTCPVCTARLAELVAMEF